MPPKKLTQRQEELCTNAMKAMTENPKKAGEVDWWKKKYSKDLAEAMKVDPENDCSCAWANACDDKLENERAYFTSDAHVAACKSNLHSVALEGSEIVQTFACKTCNKKPLANICMCDGGSIPKKTVHDKKTGCDKEVTDWFDTGAWGFGILKCKHCSKPCFMFDKTPEGEWLKDGQRSDHKYLALLMQFRSIRTLDVTDAARDLPPREMGKRRERGE